MSKLEILIDTKHLKLCNEKLCYIDVVLASKGFRTSPEHKECAK